MDWITSDLLNEFGLERFIGKMYRVNGHFRCENDRKMTQDDFLNLPSDYFLYICGIGEESRRKLIWLQRKLKGETEEEKYPKYKKDETIEIITLKRKIEKHEQKENELREKIKLLENEIIEIKRENRELGKINRTISKLKEILLNIE